MNTITTKDEKQLSRRGRAQERLTPENAALLLIDHQSGLVLTRFRSIFSTKQARFIRFLR
jgi:hypothetical protein